MINKQNLWFITLFSLIIILGVYYISMPEKSISVFADEIDNLANKEEIAIDSSDIIVAIKVEEEEKIITAMNEAKDILLNIKATAEEKSVAYEKLQSLNTKKGMIEKIEKTIKEKYHVTSCAVIDEDKITITLSIKDQGVEYANNIIKTVQELFEDQKYITVNFKEK